MLANLFLHYVFDDFMTKAYPNIWWERYADDGVLHCQSYKQAVFIKQKLEERFQQFGLELNKEKTRIVYCKDDRRSRNYSCTQFTFLGYTFRPRLNKNKEGKFFVGFTPAVSEKAKTAMKQKIRGWKIQLKADLSLKDIGNMINKVVQGWINYYTHYYKSEFYEVLRYINQCLIKWVRRSYKKKNTRSRAEHWLGAIARRDRNLFAHWKFGILPSVGDILIPLVLAGYARYLKGIDDNGQPFEISTDPLLAELQAIVAPLKVEAGEQDFSCLKALYSRTDVFGVDLYAVGLGEKIESMAKELFAGPGAVRATLHKYVKAR